MLFSKNLNFKMYLFITICMAVILAMWVYVLKLNLSKPGSLTDSFQNIFKKQTQEQNQSAINQEIINQLADELKNKQETENLF